MPVLTAAGPVLVHFIDFSQLNSVRTLPYLREWSRRYRNLGLCVIGVQAPRFPFGSDPETVEAGLDALGVDFPVAIDADRRLWDAYGCEGWPSLFLWSLGGTLAWFQFGEGEYRATEEAIQNELREIDALRELPEPMAAVRPSDEPGATVITPTPELFPGGSWKRPWVAGEDGEVLELDYEAGGAFATVEGEGGIEVEIDGERHSPVPSILAHIGAKSLQSIATGSAGPRHGGGSAGLRRIAEHPRHESHSLLLRPTPGLRIWSLSFAAGVP